MTNVVVSLSADIREIQARKFGSVTTLDTDYTLTAGAATLTGLDPSGADWCWVFTEHGINGRIRYCAVPNVASVAYADLVDVDPGSLLSTVEPAGPAWVADLADKVDKGDLVLAAKDYGAVGDGSTNDAAAINAAIAAATPGTRVQLEPGKTYRINGYLSIAGKSDLIFDGCGATIAMDATGSLYQAFRLSGTCTGVHITNVRVVGVGDVNNQQAGVLINDGASQVITDCSVTNSRFKDLTLGISVNLTTGGTLNGWLVEGCHIENIVGTESGYGYGIHVSAGTQAYSTGVRIIGNHIRGVGRHSVYHANGEGSVIANNTIRDNRIVGTDLIRPAINVTRSRDVNIIGNNVDGFADGGLIVACESGSAMDGCVISGNVFTRCGNTVPVITIGDQSPPSGTTRNVLVVGNVVRSSTNGNALRIRTGTNVLVANNLFSLVNAAGASVIQLYGVGDEGGTSNYNDNIVVRDNLITKEGGGTNYGFRFSGIETSTARVTVVGNVVAGATLSIANSAITNPNLSVS